MQKSKLYTFLKHLSSKEQKTVMAYFYQPYYSEKHPAMPALLNYILQHLEQPGKLKREEIFHHLFPEIPFNDLKLRHLAAETLQHAEQALAAYYSIADPYHFHLQLMELYRTKHLAKHYKNVSVQLETLLNNDTYRHASYFHNAFMFWQNQDLFTENRNEIHKQRYLSNASEALDTYYIANKLRMAAQMATLKKVIDSPHNIDLIQEIIAIFQNSNYLQIPVIALYYYIVMAITQPSERQYFDRLNQLFGNHNSTLPDVESREIYYFLLNYCAEKINAGQTGYLSEIFTLYQLGLSTQLIFENSVLSPWNYKNIVTVGLRQGNYDWTLQFIEEYQTFLPPQHQINAYTYNRANYYFFKGLYPQTIRLLQQVSYDEVFYSLDARTLLLKTYYELKEFEALLSLIDSFKQWLNRTKEISKPRQQTYRNLLYFLRKLIQIPPNETKKRKDLLTEITKTPAIADKRWLLQQL
ncbi:MAG: hypothetical protein IPM47_02615 [Sphingobacteriales bacterium]|nr:MAG: hypothetical protein IPM47_02615 [Sphingobacteriales bacterium]